MEKLRIKSAEILVTSEKNAPIIRNRLSSIPGKDSCVFGLVQVTGTPDEDKEEFADIVIEHVQYLEDLLKNESNIPRKFEQILQKVNDELNEKHKNHPQLALSSFSAVIGIQTKNQLFLSGIGKLHAVFLHKTAKQRYVVYELDKQLNEGQDWEKPFITVLDGEFHHGDIFYLATRINVNEITLSDLKDNLVTLPVQGALERISQYLHRNSSYGAICLKASQITSSKKPKKINPLSSVEALTKTKENTSQLLSDQTPEIGQSIKNIVQPLLKKLSAPGTSGPITLFKRTIKLLLQGLSTLLILVIKTAQNLWSFLQEVIKKRKEHKRHATESPQEDVPTPALKERIKSTTSSSFAKIKSMSRKRQFITAGTIIIVLLFTVTISTIALKKNKSEDAQIAKTVILRIEEKKNNAEASLIYNDTNQAKTLVAEAISLLDELPSNNDMYQAEIDRLRGELNDILSEIRGINEVPTTNLGTIPSGNIQTTSLINGVIYSISTTNELFQYNELNQSWDRIETTNGSIGSIQQSFSEGNTILVLDKNNILGRIDLTNATINPITSGTPGMASIEDIAVYGENVYALSAIDEQIVKMRPQGVNFDAGTPWINSRNTNITSAHSIAVDGDIYLLLNDRIVKFASGKEDAFILEQAEPALSQAIDLFTDIDSNYLYVLEAAQNRVLVYEKETGELVTQYSSPDLASAEQLIVAEEKNMIYIQTAEEIISFPAKHLLN